MTRTIRKISKYKPSVLQSTLQFEVARPRVGLALEHPLERRAVSFLTASLIAIACFYLYFVASSILHVMARSDAVAQMRTIEGSIGELEQRYLALSRNVTEERASALGLAPVEKTAYVSRPGNAARLTFDPNEL